MYCIDYIFSHTVTFIMSELYYICRDKLCQYWILQMSWRGMKWRNQNPRWRVQQVCQILYCCPYLIIFYLTKWMWWIKDTESYWTACQLSNSRIIFDMCGSLGKPFTYSTIQISRTEIYISLSLFLIPLHGQAFLTNYTFTKGC